MGRPRKNPLPENGLELGATDEPLAEVSAGENIAETPAPIRRRRRRRSANAGLISEVSDASILVGALLRSRGVSGANSDDLHAVIAWARTVRDEGEALTGLSNRPRRQKAQAPVERLTRYEMNRALLEGVIYGTIALDVNPDGSLTFKAHEIHKPVHPNAAENEHEAHGDDANGDTH